jgi:hypothetical protein
MNKKSFFKKVLVCGLIAIIFITVCSFRSLDDFSALETGFVNPPDSVRSGVYWYFLDGNLSAAGMTKDLEAMKEKGVGNVIFLETSQGIPKGKYVYMSEEWRVLFKHAVKECERLGIALSLGTGPGWAGSSGPWVKGELSMKHLVSSSIDVCSTNKATVQTLQLAKPSPRRPFFGEGDFISSEIRQKWENYYEDVAVLAFPARADSLGTEMGPENVREIDEKALYYRRPYTSGWGVKQYLAPALSDTNPTGIDISKMVDLTSLMQPDGSLTWKVPKGKWRVMRFGVRNSGAVTRSAPATAVGFEADKLDSVAMKDHLDNYTGEIFKTIGNRNIDLPGGFKILHIDSWEMGAQNWTQHFREEFIKRRKYDPQPYYPAYTGLVVQNPAVTERFLWDVRQTAQELLLETHAFIRDYAHRNGLKLAMESYDMTPVCDLELFMLADIPSCEFWSMGYFGFNGSFSAIEASSAAHLTGRSVVPAEAFTVLDDKYLQHPGSMKNQGDWALSAGVTQFYFHTFPHQSLDDGLKPGVTMGPFGINYHRNQTWWDMSEGYHHYLSRCQLMLQHGRTVADVLYLTPEAAPFVFRAPASALQVNGSDWIPDRRGYNFDGCPPSMLYKATVTDNKLVFPSGATYRLLVLPRWETMTLPMLTKIRDLVRDGLTVVGLPPSKAPGLTDYPLNDQQIQELAQELWGASDVPEQMTERPFGNGKIIWGSALITKVDNLYAPYDITSSVLAQMDIPEDFVTDMSVRYTHRTADNCDIYFVSNRTDQTITGSCNFRITGQSPELWDPITGDKRSLPEFTVNGKYTNVPLQLEPYQSYFVVFTHQTGTPLAGKNFPETILVKTLDQPWEVTFDPALGGPGKVTFNQLTDWALHSIEGIKYYSGTAVYQQTFNFTPTSGSVFLDLGTVKVMARVWLNGNDLGVRWTAPFRVDITDAVKAGNNELKIEVVNLWPNRLIGDEHQPADGIQNGQWPEWVLNHTARPSSGRVAFTTYHSYAPDAPLLESGLIGPVGIWKSK